MERRSFFTLAGFATLAAAGGALTSCGSGIQVHSLAPAVEGIHVVDAREVSFSSDVDILVVGSGIAGLSAAMNPIDERRTVMVAEKLSLLGGESYEAAGVMRVAGSALQKQVGSAMTVDQAWRIRSQELSAEGVTDLGRAELLFRTAPEWVDQLVDSYGAEFSDPGSLAESGSSGDILLPKRGLGDMESVMTPLRDRLAAKGVTYATGQRAVSFILDGDASVCGMRFMAEDGDAVMDVRAKAVVLATGGFASSQPLVSAYVPSQTRAGCYTTTSMGEGQLLCTRIGGQLGGMDMVAPLTGDVPPASAWGLFGPVLAMDSLGRRFVREDDDVAAANACFADELGYWWTVFGRQLSEGQQARSIAQVAGRHAQRMVGPYGDLAGLAGGMGVSLDILQQTFDRYRDLTASGEDSDFGRAAFLEELEAPYYALKQFPVRYKTYGGAHTDDDGRLMDASGSTVPNVYCCGSVTAGVVDGLAASGAAGLLAGRAIVRDLEASNG